MRLRWARMALAGIVGDPMVAWYREITTITSDLQDEGPIRLP